MFKSKFIKNSSTGIQHEIIDIENKKLLSEYSWFLCDEKHPFSIGFHEHTEMEIGYINEGIFEMGILNSTYKLQGGDVFIVLPNEKHSLKNITPRGSFYNFVWDLNFLESRYLDACEINYIIPLLTGSLKVSQIIHADSEINNLVENMIEERIAEKDGYELIIKGCLYQFFGALIRKYCKNDLSSKQSEINSDYEIYNKISKYIEMNFDTDLTLSQISEKFYLSKTAICKLFKKINGKTFTEYLNYFRTQESLYYLASNKFTVTQIARSVGFSDPNYYSRVFRKYMHLSPLQYRRNLFENK